MNLSGAALKKAGRYAIGLFAFMPFLLQPKPLLAVVGQAERYDEYEESKLNAFQKVLLDEDRKNQLAELEARTKTAPAASPEASAANLDIEALKQALLQMPARDRFRIEMDGQHQFDNNVERAQPLRGGNMDSLFDSNGTLLFDLSGKRTDLGVEINGGKHWSKEFPEGDFWTGGERVRYRRNYFKKISHSFQSAVTRTSTKTIEINRPKIRWDGTNNSSTNYAFSPKLSLNNDFSTTKRYFSQEPFDQDSSWEVTDAPSGFWNFTPKTRISAGYSFGANRIRTKTGDTNSHQVHTGYFGKITKKSSANLDISWSHQSPRSKDTATSNSWTTGLGYIWQMTPKTQLTLQFIRSIQNSTSDITSGSIESDDVTTTKTDTYTSNDSVSSSLNSRLTAKLNVVFTANFSHSNSKTNTETDSDSTKTKGTQYTFPLSLAVNYLLNRWATLTFGYTFSYRWGYESTDLSRSHVLQSSMRLSF